MAEFKDTTNLKGIKEGDIVNVADLKYRYTPEGTFVLENAASPLAPTSTPTPTTNINARPIRYPTEGVITPVLPQTDIEKAQSELYGAPEERKLLDEAGKSKIRADVREQFQTYLDAVNASYNRLLSEEKQRGVGRLGRTRAGAAAGGILGGSFGEQALGETERYNVELEKGVEEGRQLKLAEFFTKIDERALKEIEAQQAERKGKAEAYINFLTTSKTDTQRDIKTLASSGIKISDIPENRYKQLLNQSGMDPLQFESFYYLNLPANLKPITKDIETRLPNGNAGMIRIETDPKTEKSTQRTFDYGVKNEQLYGKYPGGTEKVNGILYGIGPDGTPTPLTNYFNNAIKLGKDNDNLDIRARTTTEEVKPLSMWEIGQFKNIYGWTPPYGFSQSQLDKYIQDNPNATPEELEAGAKQVSEQVSGGEQQKSNLNDEYFRTNYTKDELKKMSDKLGTSKWYTPAGMDINRFITEVMKKIEEAKKEGYSDEEILKFLEL